MSDMSGMDMSGSSTSAMTMKMYVHGTIGGDGKYTTPSVMGHCGSSLTTLAVLWFRTWQPESAGATVGVCIGLFLLAILDRYVHALWRACSASWARGKVGFALPVATGDLEYEYEREDRAQAVARDKSTATTTATARAVSVALGVVDESAGCGTACRRTGAAGGGDKEKDLAGPLGCDCGCGGECGSSSAPAPAPQYQSEAPSLRAFDEKRSPSPGTPESGRIEDDVAHLPTAVRRTLDPKRRRRWSRPFQWSVDIPRGCLWAFQTLLHYLLM